MAAAPGRRTGGGRGLDRLGEGRVPRDDIEQSGQAHLESLLRPEEGAARGPWARRGSANGPARRAAGGVKPTPRG
nr:hypothetical protein KPHV_50870 [Kitasatospora purpeofusca]